jgi:hypothetical protein
MTHFTVLVVGPDHEKQLAPFQENNMGDCPEEYMEFVDVTDDSKKDYEEGTRSIVLLPNGSIASKYDDRFKTGKILDEKYTYPEGSKIVEIPHVHIYPTFDDYMKLYDSGYKKVNGRYGYYENPNKKWDWWEVGGRWTGKFKLKPGTNGETGKPGLMTQPAGNGHADIVIKHDIDVEYMRNEVEQSYLKRWDIVHAGVTDFTFTTWDELLKQRDDGKITIDEARKLYKEQVPVKEFNQLIKKHDDIFGWSASLGDYLVTREEYARQGRDSALTTHAILNDGKWYERGEMGWWACCDTDLT